MTRGIRLGKLPARVEFKPQDCWIGAFWKSSGNLVDVWVCLVPMVPLHFWFLRPWKGDPTEAAAGARTYPQPSVAALRLADERDRSIAFELSPELQEAERRGRAWLNPKEAT